MKKNTKRPIPEFVGIGKKNIVPGIITVKKDTNVIMYLEKRYLHIWMMFC